MSLLASEIAQQPAVLARLLDAQLPRLDAWRAALRRDGIDGVVVVARGSSDNAARYCAYARSAGSASAFSRSNPTQGSITRLATAAAHIISSARAINAGRPVRAISRRARSTCKACARASPTR